MKLIEQGPFRAVESSYRDRLYRFLRYPLVPNAFALTMGALLVLLLVVAFAGIAVGSFNNSGPLHLGPFSSAEDENSLFNFIMWVVWLPLLSLSALVVGRLWCGNLCPLRLVSDAARSIGEKITGKGSAASPYLRLGWVLPVSFILITFVVKALPVQTVPRYGALLFLSILAAAVLVGLLMRRGAWCRYFCPIGGWLARIARLSILGLRSNASACASCKTQACLSGSSRAGRCPSFLNPSRLDSNRYCLQCWNCVKNCPEDKSSLKLGLRFPGSEVMQPSAPDLWESLFVASLIGMYMAVGHRWTGVAGWPWPAVFFGFIGIATAAYLVLCGMVSLITQTPFRRTVSTLGYIFLPFEFGTAVIAFGDDALEFFGIVQPAAAALLTLGFVWSALVAASVLRNQYPRSRRALLAAAPIGVALVAALFVWLRWYASGTVVDLT